MCSSLKAAATFAAALTVCGPVYADPFWSPLSGDWLVTIKGNLVASPQYPGSSNLAFSPSPGLSVRRAGTPLAYSAPDDNPGFALVDHGWFKFGPSARFVAARQTSSHAELKGLRDIDWTIEAGLFAEFWASENIRLRADTRHGFHGHRGLVADLAADWVQSLGQWTVSGGPRLSFANSRYMGRVFGVTPAESLASGVMPADRPGGGLKSAGLMLAASYDWSPKWRTTVWGRYDRLLAEAASSPIVTKTGSPNQFTLGATVAYSFDLRIP